MEQPARWPSGRPATGYLTRMARSGTQRTTLDYKPTHLLADPGGARRHFCAGAGIYFRAFGALALLTTATAGGAWRLRQVRAPQVPDPRCAADEPKRALRHQNIHAGRSHGGLLVLTRHLSGTGNVFHYPPVVTWRKSVPETSSDANRLASVAFCPSSVSAIRVIYGVPNLANS
jgi:hypothetical protein